MDGDRPYILEMTRRTCGDLYSLPESMAFGFNIAEWKVQAECGMDISGIPRQGQQGHYGRHCISAPRVGVTDGISFHPELEACIARKWLWSAYDHLVEDCINDCLGLLFFQFENEKQINDIVPRIPELITVHYK